MSRSRLALMVLFLAAPLLALFFPVSARAGDPVKLFVNGREVAADIPPQLVNGRTMVPVRWVAEALGAGVEWEEATSTVKIEAPPVDSLHRRLVLLEKALKPASPEEAVRNWAAAVQTRNGAWQYALLAPDLQERYLPDYERTGWVTGVSSPWVDKYAILEQKEDKEGNRLFTVQFDLLASTGPAGSSVHHITVQPRDGGWYITAIDSTVQAPAGKLLIKESTPVYAAPSLDSQQIRRVEAGAVVAILEETTGWFKVKVNVYDTPGNEVGWVPAACGEKLTKENYLQAREVFVKKDAPVYECYEYASIKQTRPTQLTEYDRVYWLVREEQDMVFLNGPGGASYWTAKENIIYIQP